MENGLSVEVGGTPITNPFLKFVLAIVMMFEGYILLTGAVLLAPLLLVPHFMLRLVRRKGFFEVRSRNAQDGPAFIMEVSSSSFERV